MNERTTNALRGLGVVAALGVMAMAVWHVTHAPAPDAPLRPLADGGRIAGIGGWPLFADVNGDGVGEVVFWRSVSNTLVAIDAESADPAWESAPVSGGSVEAHAWATRDGLFVADAEGGFSGLDPKDGRQRFRRELGERASALCRAEDGLWVTLASGRTLALNPSTGNDLGSRPAPPEGAELLSRCEPIWGDRPPDRGAARIAEHHDWAKLLGGARELAPQPLPDSLSPNVSAYLVGSGGPSWLVYGTRSDGSAQPLLARAGTRAAPLADTWTKPATEHTAPGAALRGPLLAVTRGAAYVAFFIDEERQAAVARFDLPSGVRRWEIRLAPRSLVAVSASERHVALTWSGGTLEDGVRPGSSFALMVLNAETGEKVSQIGYASHGP